MSTATMDHAKLIAILDAVEADQFWYTGEPEPGDLACVICHSTERSDDETWMKQQDPRTGYVAGQMLVCRACADQIQPLAAANICQDCGGRLGHPGTCTPTPDPWADRDPALRYFDDPDDMEYPEDRVCYKCRRVHPGEAGAVAVLEGRGVLGQKRFATALVCPDCV